MTALESTAFVYDASGALAAEYSNSVEAGGTQRLTQDALGSTRAVTGQRQEVRGRHDYLSFGEEAYAWRPGCGGGEVRQRFTGKERGLYRQPACWSRCKC